MNNWLTRTLDDVLDKTIIFSYNNIGYFLRQGLWQDKDLNVDMAGKVCVVTGANAGIGFATTQQLAARGATVYMVARNRIKGISAQDKIIAATDNTNVHLELTDISSLEAVRDLAQRLQAQTNRLDVLIHNAGILPSERNLSVDGNEMALATNVLGPFLLTHLLKPLMTQSTPSRIIFVSSGGMYTRKLNPHDLQWEEEEYNGVKVYAQTKRAQVILAEQFAERFAEDGIVVNSMHPGWVKTGGLQGALSSFSAIMKPTLRTVDQGADTIVWLAVAKKAKNQTGLFWFDRRPRPTHKVESTKSSAQSRQMLWDECMRLTGLADAVPT